MTGSMSLPSEKTFQHILKVLVMQDCGDRGDAEQLALQLKDGRTSNALIHEHLSLRLGAAA